MKHTSVWRFKIFLWCYLYPIAIYSRTFEEWYYKTYWNPEIAEYLSTIERL